MDERYKTGRGALLACTLLIGAVLLLATFPSVLAANDPGHDSLYVLLTGDSNIVGNLNISNRLNASNLKFATLLYGDYLDVRANGSIYTPSSRPAIQADTNDLYLDSLANVYIATRAGTTGRVQIGPTTGSGITLNVSGTILQQNVRVCLANGSNCASGNNTGNVTSVTAGSGLGNSGTAADPVLDVTAGDGISISADQVIINNASVCRTSGVGCPAGATAGVGWTNSSGSGNVSLTNSNVNVSINTLFVDNTNQRVGVKTRNPSQQLDVRGTVMINGTPVDDTNNLGQLLIFSNESNDGPAGISFYDANDDVSTTWYVGKNIGQLSGDYFGWYYGTTNVAAVLPDGSINTAGTFKTGGTTRISSTGVGSFATGTTVNALGICLADGTNCIVSNTNAGGGWRNGTNQVYLANNATNVSVGSTSGNPTLFVDNTNQRVGIGTSLPSATFTVNSSSTRSDYLFIATAPDDTIGPSLNAPGILLAGGRGKNNGVQAGANGGGVMIQGGAGGVGSSNNDGTAGGNLSLTAGNAGYASNGNGWGGTPGYVIISTGQGGYTPGSGNGSNGGDFLITTGTGGNSSTSTAGRGGNLTILLGSGGNSTGGGAAAGDGGSFILQAGDGGTQGKGYIGAGGSIYLTPGVNNADAGSNGSVIITRGGLGIGGGANSLLEISANYSTSAARPYPILLDHTVYGNVSFGTSFNLAAAHQLTTNTGVVIGLNIGDSIAHSNKNVTRFEVFRVAPNLAATYNGSITQVQMVKIVDPVRNNGSITTLVGFYSDDLTAGSTNNRGIQLTLTSGANKYNIYASGSASNYLQGDLSIGKLGPTRRVDVNGTAIISTDESTDDSGNPIALTLDGNASWNFMIPRCVGCYSPGATVGDLVIRSGGPGLNSLRVTASGGNNEDFTILNTSQVGINDSTPAVTLEVSSVLRLTPSDTPPSCTGANGALINGTMYYDHSLREPCFCNGTAWRQFDNGGTC